MVEQKRIHSMGPFLNIAHELGKSKHQYSCPMARHKKEGARGLNFITGEYLIPPLPFNATHSQQQFFLEPGELELEYTLIVRSRLRYSHIFASFFLLR
jgi:hypothetical protein